MSFGWTRTAFGLVSIVDTTVAGVGTAQSKVDADAGASITNNNTATATLESTYQTDRTSLKGADTGLQLVVADPKIVLTQTNGGVV
jgi:hypothetical protein